MNLRIKICGISTEETVAACVEEGVDYIGFVFYPRSPRGVTFDRAADLAKSIPPKIQKCGLFVDADETTIMRALDRVPLDLLQLHGNEEPDRCRSLRERTGVRVMKAIGVTDDRDFKAAERWYGAADFLLFDAKPPKTPDALPGGNGVAFDWSLLTGRDFPLPWLLSGGLTVDNVSDALRCARPTGIDVSSGVELSPGIKDPGLIRGFIAAARAAANRPR